MAEPYLPVEVVFHPHWWYKNYGLTFEWDFFYQPERRVAQEQRMRRLLYERFGDLGLGQKDAPRRPIIGPILLGSGYIIQEILGCEVNYQADGNPWVLPRHLSEAETWALAVPEDIEQTPSMRHLLALMDSLEAEFGYLQGDVPLHSVVNVALDLRGQDYFIDLIEKPELVRHLHTVIARTIYEVGRRVKARTGHVALSINRTIASFNPGIFTIPNCSLQMISPRMYEQQLLEFDAWLGRQLPPPGFHHCGSNAHLFAPLYARAGAVYLDVGWGSDIAACRAALPRAWLSLRLNPVNMLTATPAEAAAAVEKLLAAHPAPWDRVAVCCINMDYGTPDEAIRAMFQTVARYRGERDSGLRRAYQIA
ncbi:MAG: uroporphyrinogen decarboxylase family protein [Chloroflexota bacterium]